MKATRLTAIAVLACGLAAVPVPGLTAGPSASPGLRSAASNLVALTEEEAATLQWMREEEKLARDVYLELSAFYPARVFTNIAAAEQKHFDALGAKLVMYAVADPALPDIGLFSNPLLQQLHDELLARGIVSYAEALGVGVDIERADVIDLQDAIDGTSSRPLTRTYQHLLNGSENHLKAFTKLLGRLDIAE
jgi:hypothetical protein